jgi:UPF0176 protein
MNNRAYRILLYYKYVPINDPEAFAKAHLTFCQSLELKGRILVATEGINGTVSGTIEQTNTYMKMMHEDSRFHDMVFKIDETEGHAFEKMHVRPRNELVTFNLDTDVNPNETSGKRLKPKEFYEALQQDDVLVLDGRNDYEYEIGHFRNAIRPDVKSSKEFPEWIRNNLAQYKDKKIITYCTGGIRCEKLSGLLLEEGFKNVSQLEGGIISYGKDPEVKGRLFDGKCYVFDNRISVPINQTEEDRIIASCYHCGNPADQYVNCANVTCDLRHISCPECLKKHQRYCSDQCQISV